MPRRRKTDRPTDQIERIQAALEGGKGLVVRRSLHALHPPEIARLVESLPLGVREAVWGLVDADDRGEVLVHLPEGVREGLVELMNVEDIISATRDLEIDDLADLVEDLPETVTQRLLKSLDLEDRQRLENVLAYAPDTAGGMMNTNTVTVRPDVTLDVVIRYLRMRGRLWSATDTLFVVDRYGRYLGALPLAKILTRDPEALVHTVMERELEPLLASAEDIEVAKRFQSHDLISAPVVDDENRLVGRITVDDVVDVIQREAEHRMMRMAGLSEEEDIFAPIPVTSRKRAIWLGLNLVTAFIASWVVGFFEATIVEVVALAVLMPIVASMGGIGGTQVLTLMIRGLALGQIGDSNVRALLRKEIRVALIQGVLWAIVVGAVTAFWFHNLPLALVIGFALLFNQINGAFMGVWLPLTLKRMGIDPALAGSVILTTFTDVGGFFALLGLGSLFLL